MRCARCEHENEAGAKFCEECAAPLARACGKCGRQLSPTAKFCPECAHPTGVSAAPRPAQRFDSPESYTPKHLAERIISSKAGLEGERKQVTVLFADLKGSMELLADRDPEEARKILDPVLEHMMEAVHRYEGTVNQVMGDGIMALFGAPLAHEDHAVRACYAALRMQDSVKKYGEGVRRSHAAVVQIRVGVNSGEVVVRTIGSDLRMDYTAVGQTTHLAARMEQIADPGTIVITPETLALAEGYVEVKSLGPVPLKGLADAIDVYEVKGAGPARTRLQAATRRGLTRFVGREAELELLRRAQDLASRGHGQVAAIVGEAGVGKSRLVYELAHSHRMQGWLILESSSVSYGKATSYLPVIDLLKAYFKIQDRDDLRQVREKVTGKLFALDRGLEPALSAFLALLDVPVDDASWSTLDPGQRRQHTLDAVRRLLLREAREQPVLVIFEDLHWIDSETQAVLETLVESLGSTRLLLLVNYRPDYRHSWGSKSSYSQLRLDTLPAESAGMLLDALLGEDPGLVPLKQLLVKRGNPFFLEETIRTLADTKALVGERGRYRLTKPLHTIQVPPTVQAMLAARIDRLSPEDKRLLQVAAVVGNDVPFAILQAIAQLTDEALRRGLDHLQAAEFVYETGLYPDLEYTFTHSLTHEVAYGSLLHDRRRDLHARIVERLEAIAGERVAEHVERLAHHAVRGERWNEALAYCRQAGEKAVSRSAYREAVGYFEQALGSLPHLAEQRDSREDAIDLRLSLRNALLPTGDPERILLCLREAEDIAVALNDRRRLGQISGFLSVHYRNMGSYDEAIAAARRALELANASGDTVVRARANLYLGAAYWGRGDYQPAIECFRQTTASLHGAQRRERLGQTNLPSVQSLAFLAACHAELGMFAEGTAFGEEGLEIAEGVGTPGSIMWASYGLGLLSLCKGDMPRALGLLERAMGICREADFRLFVPRIAAALGEALTLAGRVSDALAVLTPALNLTLSPAMAGFRALCSIPLCEAYLRAGRLEDAYAVGQQALALAEGHRERRNQAHASRLLGEIAAQGNPPDVGLVESRYRHALGVAADLNVQPLVAHCHLGLSTFYHRTGKRERAREHLAAATTMYREMGMGFWLEKAESEMGG